MGKGSALVQHNSFTNNSSDTTLKVVHKRKHFFLDTSSLMLNPLGLFKLASCKIDDTLVPVKTFKNIASVLDTVNKDMDSESPNNVYISEMVEWELNNIKDTKQEEFDAVRQAREVIGVLRHIKEYGDARGESLIHGITLPNGAKIYSVQHDEALFLKSNIQRYEPTRDDRILFDYFRVPTNSITDFFKTRELKHFLGKPTIVIPKGAIREIITEDHNFEGAVYDMKGKTGLKFSCNSLKSERTRHPNPAEKYTGIYQRPIILNPKDYSWAMDLKDNKSIIPINELTAKAINVDDFKDLDNIVMNQFVNVQSSEMQVVSDIPIGFFLRRQSEDYLSYLKYSTEFMEEEYNPKKQISRAPESKSIMPVYTTNKDELRTYLIKYKFNKKQGKNLLNKISRAETENEFKDIHKILQNKIHGYLNIGSPKSNSSSYSRQQLLDTRFNPEVVPVFEQILFIEYLNDPSIGLVSLLAPQGAGKTIFALESGLRQVRLGLYDKIIYARPVVVTGEDTGYNPGKPAEKIKPLMIACEDAIAKAYSFSESSEFYNNNPSHKINDTNAFINGLFEKNILDYQVMTNMAGRTLARAFIIMDEAHLLNREQLRLFLGRTGETSKVVLLGDYAQLGAANADVIRKYGLTPDKLGMSHLIEKVLVNNNKVYTDIYGHISINRPFTKRSKVAAIGNIL